MMRPGRNSGNSYQSIGNLSSSSSSGRRDSGARSGHAAQHAADLYSGRNGGRDSLRSWVPGNGRLRSFLFGRGNGMEASIPEEDIMPSWQQNSISSEHPFAQSPNNPGMQPTLSSPMAPSAQGHGDRQAMRNPQDEEDDRWNWIPDEKSKNCFDCGTSFTAFRRRHHCRLCGQIFCHSCSSNFVTGKTINKSEEKSRVCMNCLQHVKENMKDATDGFQVDERTGRRHNSSQQTPEVSHSESAEESTWTSTAHASGTGSRSTSLTNPGETLNVSADREEEESDENSDSRSDPNDVAEDYESDDEDDFGERGTMDANLTAGWTSRTTSARALDSDVDSIDSPSPFPSHAWETQDVFLPKAPPLRQTELGLPAAAFQHLASVLEDPSSGVELRVAAKKHEEAWRKISEEAFRHFARSVRACCQRMAGGLEDQQVILSICELARQVTDHIAPLNGDVMDILSYVKIKRIPGGSITDSQWVDGVVFSRDVAHRKMATCLSNCHIVLLGGSLSFDTDDRHTILNELHKQEDRSLGNKVQKIADLQPMPEVLLCQGGVSQMARSKLREKNISLILGVPPHILKAVERCTGATVLRAVESIEIRENAVAAVGESRYFAVQHTGDVGSKSLAVIESSLSHRNRCCTICLRGGGSLPEKEAQEFLSHAKRVLQWAIRLARHLQLESKLLFEVWCGPRPTESPETFWQKIGSQPEDHQNFRFCEKCRREYKHPEPPGGICCGMLVKDGRRPNAPVPKTCDDVLCGESLDLLCYSVSKADLTCSRPLTFCLPAYVSPDCEPEPPQTSFPNGLGWAGGLDVHPLQGIRDCTLQEWLRNCFMVDNVSAATAPQQTGGCFPAPGLRGAVGSDANRIHASNPNEGCQISLSHAARGAGLDASYGSGFYKASAGQNHVHSRLAHGEPPVPTKGEVLCFQHLRSRIIVELRDHDDPLRERTHSDCQRGSNTRWTLLQNRSEEGFTASLNDSAMTMNIDSSVHPDTASHLLSSSKGQSSGTSDSFEVWRWCKCCKNHHVTPRHALSSSAGWLSFAKFLETLLHNSTSKCCPLSTNEGEPCAHSVFRDHVLFFSCPPRPMVVGFKWERIDAWQLQPPNLPLWNPKTFALEDGPNPPESDNRTPNFQYDNCDKLWSLYHELVQLIDAFLGCALAALSVVKDEDSGMESHPMRPAALSVSSRSSANLQAAEFQFELAMDGTRTMKPQSLAPHVPSKSFPAWLRGWVWENKGAWHRAIRDLTALQAYLRKHLVIAKNRLESSPIGNDVDPVVVGFVQRDLLEGLGSEPPALGDRPVISVKAACDLLKNLAQLKNSPQIEDSAVQEQQGMSAIPMPHVFSNLLEGARRHGAALLSNFTTPMGHSESEANTYTSDDCRRRSRSKSQTRTSMRSRLQRSNSFDGCVGELSAESRCSPRFTPTADFSESEGNMRSLHDELPRILKEISQKFEQAVMDEALMQKASLPRGVRNLSLPVHEEDVGSVISYALLSCETEDHMKAQWERVVGKNACCPCSGLHGSPASCCFFSLPLALRTDAVSRSASSFMSDYCCSQVSDISMITPSMPTIPHDSVCTSRLLNQQWKRLPELFGDEIPLACRSHSWEKEWEQLGARNVLTVPTPVSAANSIKLETPPVGPDSTTYQVTIYHAPQYHILRHWLCGDDLNFVRSLHRCNSIRPTGGKSGAAFFISNDKRFLVKAVNKHEFRLLIEKGEALFRYADQVLFDKLPSVLAQVLGVFTVAVRRGRNKQVQLKRNYIVQRNLRWNLWSRPHSCFDLKGVGKNRRVAGTALPVPGEKQLEDDVEESTLTVGGIGIAESTATNLHGLDFEASALEISRNLDAPTPPANKSVLWDQNFREWRDGKPLCLPGWDLKYLEAAVWNDTCLLSGQSLVDYSMLLAAAPPEGMDTLESYGTVAIGIIDYLRPYTWDKQLETTVKSMTSAQPTVIEPSDYSKRFRHAMGTFFVAETPSPQCE